MADKPKKRNVVPVALVVDPCPASDSLIAPYAQAVISCAPISSAPGHPPVPPALTSTKPNSALQALHPTTQVPPPLPLPLLPFHPRPTSPNPIAPCTSGHGARAPCHTRSAHNSQRARWTTCHRVAARSRSRGGRREARAGSGNNGWRSRNPCRRPRDPCNMPVTDPRSTPRGTAPPHLRDPVFARLSAQPLPPPTRLPRRPPLLHAPPRPPRVDPLALDDGPPARDPPRAEPHRRRHARGRRWGGEGPAPKVRRRHLGDGCREHGRRRGLARR